MHVFGLVACQLVAGVAVEAGAMELVGTRLQNGVDDAALKIAFAHVDGATRAWN